MRIDLARADADHRTDDQVKMYHIPPFADKPELHGIAMYFQHTGFDGFSGFQYLNAFLAKLGEILAGAVDVEAPLP